MPKPAPGQSPLYKGTFDCAKKIFLKEVFIMKTVSYFMWKLHIAADIYYCLYVVRCSIWIQSSSDNVSKNVNVYCASIQDIVQPGVMPHHRSVEACASVPAFLPTSVSTWTDILKVWNWSIFWCIFVIFKQPAYSYWTNAFYYQLKSFPCSSAYGSVENTH